MLHQLPFVLFHQPCRVLVQRALNGLTLLSSPQAKHWSVGIPVVFTFGRPVADMAVLGGRCARRWLLHLLFVYLRPPASFGHDFNLSPLPAAPFPLIINI